MDRVARLRAPQPPDTLFPWVDDLARYPDWLDIVVRAAPDPALDGAEDGAGAEAGPAWRVDLRGRLGPLARSKRLRMVRVAHDPPRSARFERRERDGRAHAPWALAVEVAPDGDGGSTLTMALHYGGTLFGPVLDRLLGDEIERSRPRLLACLGPAPPPRPRG